MLSAPHEGTVGCAVEVCLKPSSTARPSEVKEHILALLESKAISFVPGPLDFSPDEFLVRCVASARIADLEEDAVSDLMLSASAATVAPAAVPFWRARPRVYVFQLSADPPVAEAAGEDADGGGAIAQYTSWALPSAAFEGLWESLVLDHFLKSSLLAYAASSLLFADAGVDSHIVTANHVVLLHGPPGTGKTSLCKALAHKLAIRLSGRYPAAQLIEINAHSLFSRWFSESGKLVSKLFAHITEIVEDEDTLVFLLIDEVESLTAARKAAMSGGEPSDAVRVVNAVLTAIDTFRTRSNVLLLTTSNISGAIDVAFVDRADYRAFIGLPTEAARYEILVSCVRELCRVGLVESSAPFPTYSTALSLADSTTDDPAAKAAALMLAVARAADGRSGRALRKLPLQAHALFVRSAKACPADRFVAALLKTLQTQAHMLGTGED